MNDKNKGVTQKRGIRNSRIQIVFISNGQNLCHHPTKNEADKMERCLEAVFNQTIKPHEVLVVDGHSTDRTVKNGRKFPVRILYEDYGTVGWARQVGLENTEGDFMASTAADCRGIL